MLHRAILGSIERFIGVLIESNSGKLPMWLTPVQLVLASITEEVVDYTKELYNECIKNNIRTELDIRNEQISYKIREHSNNKIPVIFIIGKKEIINKSVSIRRLGSKNQQVVKFKKALEQILEESRLP